MLVGKGVRQAVPLVDYGLAGPMAAGIKRPPQIRSLQLSYRSRGFLVNRGHECPRHPALRKKGHLRRTQVPC